MTFRVENRNSLGRVVNGQASFNDLGYATRYMFDVLKYCRGSGACQIKQVLIYKDDQLLSRASV